MYTIVFLKEKKLLVSIAIYCSRLFLLKLEIISNFQMISQKFPYCCLIADRTLSCQTTFTMATFEHACLQHSKARTIKLSMQLKRQTKEDFRSKTLMYQSWWRIHFQQTLLMKKSSLQFLLRWGLNENNCDKRVFAVRYVRIFCSFCTSQKNMNGLIVTI